MNISVDLTLKKQKGMTLIVALVLVALMSIVAVSAIRGSNLQEAMAGNMRDRNIAFQSAEAALNVAEDTLTGLKVFKPEAALGQYDDLQKPGKIPPYSWSTSDWGTKSKALSIVWDTFTAKPQYAIEFVTQVEDSVNTGGAADFDGTQNNVDKEFYRITSRDTGLTGNAEVILQATYIR